jgi:hypothetical protein
LPEQGSEANPIPRRSRDMKGCAGKKEDKRRSHYTLNNKLTTSKCQIHNTKQDMGIIISMAADA